MEYIPINKLEIGKRYELEARNLSDGVWSGTAFVGMREKFGHKFLDEELHYDEGPPHGTAKPLKLI